MTDQADRICDGCGLDVAEGTGTRVANRGWMHSRCAKIGKAHGRVVEMVPCQNCRAPKPKGGTCFQCGVSERVGP